MQQNAAGQGHPARVQFPEQLPGAEIPRPPSARPLPRVGSHSKDHSIVYAQSHGGEGFERSRTASVGSSSRPEGLGLGLGRPSRSPAHGPSPLNPTRRGSGQHSHRKRDSSEVFDASKYDFDDALGPAEPTHEPPAVAPEHLEALERLAQRRRRHESHGHRGERPLPPITSSMRYRPVKSPVPASVALDRDTVTSGTTLATSSSPQESKESTTLRSYTPPSQDNPLNPLSMSRGDLSAESDELWTSRLQRPSKGRPKPPLTEEQHNIHIKDTDDRIANIKKTASSGSWERARTTADQLGRRYRLILPSVGPDKKPFNLMDVMRWRRQQFEGSAASSISSRDAEIERQSLSWRPHLSDLWSPDSARYRSRMYAPWHLTALAMELAYQPSNSPITTPPRVPLIQADAGSSTDSALVPAFEPSPKADTSGGDVSAENDSNRSGGDPLQRGLRSLSIRRLKRSFPGAAKSLDLSHGRSTHQSKSSISSLQLFSHSAAGSPSQSRVHANRLIDRLTSPKSVGEQSDEGEHSARSANEKDIYDSPSSIKPGSKAHLSGGESDLLVAPSSEDDRAVRSSDDVKLEPRARKRLSRPFFMRDETVVPPTSQSRQRAASTPIPTSMKTYSPDLGSMLVNPDPQRRIRLALREKETVRSKSQEERDQKKRRQEERRMDRAYDRREEHCHTLDDLIKAMNQEQYQLLQLGREYLHQAAELRERFDVKDFSLLTDHDLRVLTEPTSRSQAHYEELSRLPGFIDERIRAEGEATVLFNAIAEGRFAPPIHPERYFDAEENLEPDLRKLEVVGWDLDYVARVATDHGERSKRLEEQLTALKGALGGAFAHSSQIFRELGGLENIVARSRPVPTWKKISDHVKPMLSWGVRILTWILKFLGEISRIIGFFMPPFLKNLFSWEMLSGSWPRFVFAAHLGIILCVRWIFGLYWSFETGLMGLVWKVVLAYVFYATYFVAGWYTREVRYYVLNDWLESRQPFSSGFLQRHWFGLLLLMAPPLVAFPIVSYLWT